MKPKIIAIVGPTASGKSALGVFLAKKLGGEIISADSRQIYKGLDIGTGKITKKEMAGVPHHMLSVASPKRQFSVDDFVKRGRKILHTAIYRSIPIVVGGTGFYVDALLGRANYANVPPDPVLRARLEKKSVVELLAELKKLDPRRAKTIEPHHKRRIIRAIEVAKALGKNPLPAQEELYDVLWLGLNPTDLEERIRARLRARLKMGMITEANRLHAKGLSYKRMEELGLEYRHLARLLQKKLSEQELKAALEGDIVKYAKRQMRWFKRNKDIHWVSGKTEALKLSKKFLAVSSSDF